MPDDPEGCPYCGEALRGRKDFCTACGEDLSDGGYDPGSADLELPDFLTDDANEETYEAAGIPGVKSTGSGWSVRRVIVALVALALALAVFLWSLNG